MDQIHIPYPLIRDTRLILALAKERIEMMYEYNYEMEIKF